MHPSLLPQLPQIAALCETHGVLHLELFGSATGAAFDPESSDYDFLVELDAQVPGSRAKRWMALADGLEQLLGLFRLDFDQASEMRADLAGMPVYLGLAMDRDQGLRLKPQNLLLNLPLAQRC